VSALKVGAGLELLRPHDDLDMLGKLTLAVAYRPAWWASVGFSYARTLGKPTDRSYGELDTVSVGLHLRANRRLSFGMVARDLNAPKPSTPSWLPAISRSYEFETLIEPLGDSRFSIGLSARVGEMNPEVHPRLRIWFRPVSGLGVGLDGGSVFIKDADPREKVAWRAGVGLSIDFAQVGASVFQLFGRGQSAPVGYHGGALSVRVSQERYPAIWEGPKSVLRLHLGEVSGRTLLRTLLALKQVERNRKYEGVLVIVNDVPGNWATAQEIRQALVALRKAGKRVLAYGADLSMREYYVASAADEILLDPVGLVRLSGIAQGTTHVKEALLRLGVAVDLVRIGDYKASPESFTRDGPSERTRLQRQKVVDDLSQQVFSDIATSRGLALPAVEKLIEEGQYLPTAAQQARLVDGVADQTELHHRLAKVFGSSVRLENLPTGGRSLSVRPHGVAVIEVWGDLVEGRSFKIPYVDFQVVGAQTLSEALVRASQDPRVEAVVLRVDSPGGSALAADLLSRQVSELAQTKPVICSFGDIAASGGYYLAAPCREIFADSLTITGSIGIFGGKVDASGLFARLGVERARYVRGEHADMESPFRSYTDKERELLLQRMQAGYERFLSVVKAGRKLSSQEVQPVAEGRIFSGKQAMAGRLVDRMGGLTDAVARARELAGLSGEKDAEVLFWPEQPKHLLGELLGVAQNLVSDEPFVLSGVVRKVVGMIPGVVWALCLEGDVLARMDEEPVAL
jgi:protease-4